MSFPPWFTLFSLDGTHVDSGIELVYHSLDNSVGLFGLYTERNPSALCTIEQILTTYFESTNLRGLFPVEYHTNSIIK